MAMLRRTPFRTRLLAILSLFGLLPALAVTLVWAAAVGVSLPLFSESTPWERVAESGNRLVTALEGAQLSPAQREALEAHRQVLQESLTQARRFRYLAGRAVPVVALGALAWLAVIAVVAWRVAGHLSRQLSRPLAELLDWTERIARNEELPPAGPLRGAPEFQLLRERMRRLATEVAQGRLRAVEGERLAAFRESAHRFAHELRNPLTPIRLAVARLQREAPPHLAEVVEVLDAESQRLERMSRSFAQFGRLPEGPHSDVDVAELVRYAARATVPPDMEVEIETPDEPALVRGQHDALQRAVENLLRNAVEASPPGGKISATVQYTALDGSPGLAIAVEDRGCGIPPDRIERIWDPYVTSKAGGTGLGLAIVRQVVEAHGGRVFASSGPGQGSRVGFVLPASRAAGTSQSR